MDQTMIPLKIKGFLGFGFLFQPISDLGGIRLLAKKPLSLG